MILTKFDGVNKNELSMIEVAHEVLEQKGTVMDFNELLIEVQEFLELSENELEAKMSIFYTEMNTDGSFISLGGNRWGLRSWYPLDSIDEELASAFDEESTPTRRKKRKKLNAFATSDDDLDYNDDDPEDDMGDTEDDEDMDDLDEDSENEELSAYHNDLSELNEDDDTEDEASADEDLSIVSDESLFEDM